MSFLIDTNIIAYAYDNSEPEKRKKCFELLNKIFNGEKEAHISNQILGELFYTLTKNFKKTLDKEKANLILRSLIKSSNWVKINYTHKTIEKAIILSNEYNLPFWDSLISATMLENNILTIYTENEKDFKNIPGIKVINPLK
jgi:predicted nucleic acid-binding protein